MLKKKRVSKKKDESSGAFDRSSSTLKTTTPQRRVASSRVKIDRQPKQEFKGISTDIFDLKMKLAKNYFSGDNESAPASFMSGSKFKKPTLFEIGSKLKQAFDIATRTRQSDMFTGRPREPRRERERPVEVKVPEFEDINEDDEEVVFDRDEGKHDDEPFDTMDNFEPPVSVRDDDLFNDDGDMSDQFDEEFGFDGDEFTNLPDRRKIQVDVTDIIDGEQQESFPFFPELEPQTQAPEQQTMQD
jgi:hypothetical protein